MNRTTVIVLTAAALFAATPWIATGAERAMLAEYFTIPG
jgi:hypothetical protein